MGLWALVFAWHGYHKKSPLQWCHDDRDGFSNHWDHDCLINHLFMTKSKKTSKLCVTGLCEGNSPVTGEFPAQRASNAENISIWWCNHDSLWSTGDHLKWLLNNMEVYWITGAPLLKHIEAEAKFGDILQMTFWNWFSWMKIFAFPFKCH